MDTQGSDALGKILAHSFLYHLPVMRTQGLRGARVTHSADPKAARRRKAVIEIREGLGRGGGPFRKLMFWFLRAKGCLILLS